MTRMRNQHRGLSFGQNWVKLEKDCRILLGMFDNLQSVEASTVALSFVEMPHAGLKEENGRRLKM